MKAAPKSILVIRFSSLGDVVLTVPVFEALKRAFPQSRLTAAVKRAYADALAGHPAIDALMVMEPGESIGSFVRRVRRERFDAVVDLHANLRSRIICVLAGARDVLRYRKAAWARRLFVGWRRPSVELKSHTLERYLSALSPWGIPVPVRPPRRILLIQTAFLGDAVLTLPLLDVLHSRFPEAAITVLCTPETAEVFGSHASNPSMHLYDKRGRDRSWRSLPGLVKDLRRASFDWAVLPHRSFKSALVAWLAGIPRRVGFSRSQGRWMLTDVVPFDWGVHDVERNLRLVEGLGGMASPVPLSMRADAETIDAVRRRLGQAGVASDARLFGINAGSVWPTKRWLPEGFAAVAARAAQELGLVPVLIGGTKDREVSSSVSRLVPSPVLDWTGQTTLKELIALISLCRVFLTNDSGPMHIAVATGVPTVSIFGPTTRELGFFPYGPGHRVIERDLACRPCGLHGHHACPLGHFKCMKDISPEEVFAAVRASLS